MPKGIHKHIYTFFIKRDKSELTDQIYQHYYELLEGQNFIRALSQIILPYAMT